MASRHEAVERAGGMMDEHRAVGDGVESWLQGVKEVEHARAHGFSPSQTIKI
jgi:hypothetical protein